LKGAGINGKKLLGAAILAGAFSKGYKGSKGKRWKSRRSYFGGGAGEEDEFEEFSEALDTFNLEHYFGYQTISALSVLANPDFTQWLFNCGIYGGEFRTKFLFFKLARTRAGDLGQFSANVKYVVVSGLTNDGEFSAYKETPCVFVAGNTSLVAGNPNNQIDCLPGDAQVSMARAESKRVDQLVEGDETHAGGRIFMFTHKDPERIARFLRFETTGAHLEVTPGHYVYANGRLVAAREVRVGDALRWNDGSSLEVTSVRTVMKRGVFNPQTITGDIIARAAQDVLPSVQLVYKGPLRRACRVVSNQGLKIYCIKLWARKRKYKKQTRSTIYSFFSMN